jgi:hypothetical protein
LEAGAVHDVVAVKGVDPQSVWRLTGVTSGVSPATVVFAPDPLTVRWSTPAVPTASSWSELLFGPVLSDGSAKSGVKWTTPVPDRSFTATLSPRPVSSLSPKPNQVTSLAAATAASSAAARLSE